MLAQVEVGTGVNTFHLLEAEGHLILNVCRCIGIVRQLVVIVKTIFVRTKTKCLVPSHTNCLPVFEPLQLFSRRDEELHLHLLELTHAEDELARHDLIAERLAYLSDAEGDFHSPCLLHVEEVDEDSLCCLGTKIDLHGSVGG